MFSFKSIVLIAAAFTIGAESSAVAVPAAAPLYAPASVGYTHAVPQNIPPYASQISVVNRALNPVVAASYAASIAPVAAALAAPVAAPLAAPLPAPLAPAPYFTGPVPAPYALPGPYGAPAAYAAAPYPYSAPLYRSPYGYAPAYLR